MNNCTMMIALFDLDGVLMDTESMYTEFWNERGRKYLSLENFGHTIKGQTLVQILSRYFPDRSEEFCNELEAEIDEFERTMPYEFTAGAWDFVCELKDQGIPIAIVTSSNKKKMANVYRSHPELPEIFDSILTMGDFTKSKPDPECFIKGMEKLSGSSAETVVFEDSIHGINAARASGAYVVGLTTSNPREVIEPICDMVIDSFAEISYQTISAKLHSR